jgi:predicted small lipoprotein YifL
MTWQNRKTLIAIASIVAIGLLVSGCGRRGNLEVPMADSVITKDEKGNTVQKPAPKPDKPFILDGLI